MRDMVGSAWVLDARGHPLGDAKAALDLAQSQNPAVRSRPPSNLTTTFLPATGDRPGSGSIGSFMAGVAFLNAALF
jgi:hypothetical protein